MHVFVCAFFLLIVCVRVCVCVFLFIVCVGVCVCVSIHPSCRSICAFPEPSVAQPPHPNPSSPTPIIDSKAKIHYDNNDELLMMVITTELAVRVALISHAYIHKRSNSAGGEQQIRT